MENKFKGITATKTELSKEHIIFDVCCIIGDECELEIASFPYPCSLKFAVVTLRELADRIEAHDKENKL